jgi:hypothetical protein
MTALAALPFLSLSTPDHSPSGDADALTTGERLAKLHRAYLAAYTAKLELHRVFEEEHDRAWEMPDGEARDRAYALLRDDEKLGRKEEAHSACYDASRKLHDAIMEASGKGEATMDDWHDPSRPLALVRIGNRIYIATGEHELDMYEGEPPGRGEVIVIDLAEIGGGS